MADTLLGDAENIIRVRLPGKTLDEDVVDHELLKQVVGAAVARVLKNPEGYRSETAGGVSYSIDTRAASGFLTILDEEWRLLGLASPVSGGGAAFAVAPTLGTAYGTPGWAIAERWSLWP